MIRYSSLSAVAGSGTAPAASYSTPLWTSSVASPPSSRIMFGPSPSGHVSACSVHHQYSSSVSPFQAKTGMPAVGDRRGGVILGREDVARRPADLGAERDERLDQHGGLDRHVQRAGDARALERLRVGELARGSTSGRASRARRAGSPCGRKRRGRCRRPCSRSYVDGGHTVSGVGVECAASGSSAGASPARSAASRSPARRRGAAARRPARHPSPGAGRPRLRMRRANARSDSPISCSSSSSRSVRRRWSSAGPYSR